MGFMKKGIAIIYVAVTIIFACSLAVGEDASFKVIVNVSNQESSLLRAESANTFSKPKQPGVTVQKSCPWIRHRRPAFELRFPKRF